MKKIAFFDIDGTLTSEIDGSIPQSAITAIRKARANGNLMFLNSGKDISKTQVTVALCKSLPAHVSRTWSHAFRKSALTDLSADAALIFTAAERIFYMSHSPMKLQWNC